MNTKVQSEAAERYDLALREAGEDYTSISIHLDVSKQTAQSWSVGEKILNASASNVLKLCQKLNIRPEWLLFGEGSMEPTIDTYELDIKILARVLMSLDNYIKNSQKEFTYEQKATYIDILYEKDSGDLDPELINKFLKRIEKLSKL